MCRMKELFDVSQSYVKRTIVDFVKTTTALMTHLRVTQLAEWSGYI